MQKFRQASISTFDCIGANHFALQNCLIRTFSLARVLFPCQTLEPLEA